MLRFTRHARWQMQRRRISEGEVNEALESPETSYPSRSHPGTRIVVPGTTREGRRLKIVVWASDPGFVVTVADRDVEE